MVEGDVQHGARARLTHVVAVAAARSAPQVAGVDAVLGENRFDIRLVLGGDSGFDVLRGQIGRIFGVHAVGDDKINAVGFAVDVLVQPVQLDLEALRRVTRGAQHAHAASLADFGDDVTAMAESEQRKFDAEAFTKW